MFNIDKVVKKKKFHYVIEKAEVEVNSYKHSPFFTMSMICIMDKKTTKTKHRSLRLKQAAYVYQNMKNIYIYYSYNHLFIQINFFILDYVSITSVKYFR